MSSCRVMIKKIIKKSNFVGILMGRYTNDSSNHCEAQKKDPKFSKHSQSLFSVYTVISTNTFNAVYSEMMSLSQKWEKIAK